MKKLLILLLVSISIVLVGCVNSDFTPLNMQGVNVLLNQFLNAYVDAALTALSIESLPWLIIVYTLLQPESISVSVIWNLIVAIC